jgi:hypothetical protein
LRAERGAERRRAARGGGDAVERGRCGLETLILVDERLERGQSRTDLVSFLIQETYVCH